MQSPKLHKICRGRRCHIDDFWQRRRTEENQAKLSKCEVSLGIKFESKLELKLESKLELKLESKLDFKKLELKLEFCSD